MVTFLHIYHSIRTLHVTMALQGTGLDNGATVTDYAILLDLTECSGLDLISNRISCQPPSSEDDIERSHAGQDTILVSVSLYTTQNMDMFCSSA